MSPLGNIILVLAECLGLCGDIALGRARKRSCNGVVTECDGSCDGGKRGVVLDQPRSSVSILGHREALFLGQLCHVARNRLEMLDRG